MPLLVAQTLLELLWLSKIVSLTTSSRSCLMTLTSFTHPRWSCGGGFTFIKMTWYANDRDIKFGTLLKEGLLHSPSFTKVLHPIFWFWYFVAGRWANHGGGSPLSKWHDITMTEISSTASYFLIFVFWGRKVSKANLPAPKYFILFFLFLVLWCS